MQKKIELMGDLWGTLGGQRSPGLVPTRTRVYKREVVFCLLSW